MTAPDERRLESVGELRDLLERHRMAAGNIDHQAAQRIELRALFRNGSSDDVNQIDVIAQLGDCGTRQDGIDGLAQRLRTDAEGASSILVDFDADYLGGLVPVEVDVARIRSLSEQ